MGALHIDFVVPMILLGAAILGVVVVRQLTLYGARRAKRHTARLLRDHADGMAEQERASSDG